MKRSFVTNTKSLKFKNSIYNVECEKDYWSRTGLLKSKLHKDAITMQGPRVKSCLLPDFVGPTSKE